MDESLSDLVRRRARDRCEYCHLPIALTSVTFEIDHIIARKHRGETVADNLALSCFYCNSYKGPNISGIDPDSGTLTRLFNPRVDDWKQHFQWNGAYLFGLTPVGRTTIAVLGINNTAFVRLRGSLVDEGAFPLEDSV